MRNRPMQKLIVAAIIAFAVFGCTRHSSNDPTLPMPTGGSAMASYFPATDGWTSVFDVSSNGSSGTLTFYVGGEVSVQGQDGYRWVIIPSQGSPDTNYVVVGQTSLLVYQDSLSSPEHLLQLPLTHGSSWLRFPEQAEQYLDTASILTDITGGKLDTTTEGPGPQVRKLLPVEGGNELTVAAIEELTTAGDRHFSGAVKISNTDRDGSTNSYWFVAGVGLVKYVIGATTQNPDGVTVGEIIDYGVR